MTLIYDRKTGTTTLDRAFKPDGGTWGSISLRRLCETIEMYGDIPPGHRVTTLAIDGDVIGYRVEPRGGQI